MSAIRDIGKFKIFIPDAGDIAWGSRIIAESNALNAEFISANPLPEPEMKISGTFICGHAPDYIDINMVDANVEAWDRLLPGCAHTESIQSSSNLLCGRS